MFIYDTRCERSVHSFIAHPQEVNVISFNPVERYLFATASSDQTISLWDHRNLSKPIHSLIGHKGEIYSCCWSTFNPQILASAGVDRRVNLWDLSRVNNYRNEMNVNRLE